MATIAAPPVRRAVREYVVKRLSVEAGPLLTIVVDALDSGGAMVARFVLDIRTDRAGGLRYAADGGVEEFTQTNPAHAATDPAAAFTAFMGAAGGFPTKAAALESWMQSVGLLPA